MEWYSTFIFWAGITQPEEAEIFDKDEIEWNSNNDLSGFYTSLLNLRTNNPAVRSGDPAVQTFRLKTSADKNIIAYVRKNGSKEVLVVLNFSSEKNLRFDITDEHVTGIYKNIFSGAANDFTSEKSFEIQPWEYLVYEK